MTMPLCTGPKVPQHSSSSVPTTHISLTMALPSTISTLIFRIILSESKTKKCIKRVLIKYVRNIQIHNNNKQNDILSFYLTIKITLFSTLVIHISWGM